VAVGDRLEITQAVGGYLLSLKLQTDDPNLVRTALEVLFQQADSGTPAVRSGTLEYGISQDEQPSGEAPQEEEQPEASEGDEPAAGVPLAVRQAELANLDKLNGFLWEGRMPQAGGWTPFGMPEWEDGRKRYASRIDPVEAELIRGEYLAEQRELHAKEE
jgi:hypothetical protein